MSITNYSPPSDVPQPVMNPAGPRLAWRVWLGALLLGLELALLLLIASWLLRSCTPLEPTISLSAVEAPVAPAPAAPAAVDSSAALKASLARQLSDGQRLRTELAALDDDLKRKLQQCRPAQPPTAPEPALPAARWNQGDLSVLKGCWILGRDVNMVHLRRRPQGSHPGQGRTDLLQRRRHGNARTEHGGSERRMALPGADRGKVLGQRHLDDQAAVGAVRGLAAGKVGGDDSRLSSRKRRPGDLHSDRPERPHAGRIPPRALSAPRKNFESWRSYCFHPI